MTRSKRFGLKGQEHAKQPYHYRACGLDDIYLINGFEPRETAYGPAVSIADVPGLHRAIGLFLVTENKPLTAREFRFLRKNMDLTQEGLADRFRVDAQTIARHEKDQTAIPGSADFAIRVLFLLHVAEKEQREDILEDLQELKSLLETDLHSDSGSPNKMFDHDPKIGWTEHASC